MSASFWSQVDTSRGPMGCWPWKGARTPDGYGRVTVDGQSMLAHRVACEMQHGPMKPGQVARHMCVDRSSARLSRLDERACCNPAHMEPGSQSENMRDRVRHGRGKGQRPRPNPDRRLW